MWDRITLFAVLVFGFVYCATTAEPLGVDNFNDARPFEPQGAAMRRRNERAQRECSGTVAQRRACWLEMPLE